MIEQPAPAVNPSLSQTTDTAATRSSGYAIAVLSSAGSGVSTVIGKWNLMAISPLLMNSLIFSVATVVLSGILLPARGVKNVFTLSRKGWLWIGLFSGISVFALWTFWAGVQKMDPSLAAFLNRVEVFIAILLGIIFLKERFDRWETLGALLSVGGIVVMRLSLRVEYSEGFWLVLLGSLFFGITEFISKIAVRYVEPTVLTYIRAAITAAAFWIIFFSRGMSFEGLERVWPGVIALGVMGPLVARLLYLSALKRLELSRVAVISQMQPIFVILIAFAFLSQLPTFREIVGGICISVGCLLMILARHRTGIRNSLRVARSRER
ncbi:MAG: DMT family transporter [candidate division Zixibacteria bacterium]|nr:DMT family transporter [candidate division Zixibacteria bacterium]